MTTSARDVVTRKSVRIIMTKLFQRALTQTTTCRMSCATNHTSITSILLTCSIFGSFCLWWRPTCTFRTTSNIFASRQVDHPPLTCNALSVSVIRAGSKNGRTSNRRERERSLKVMDMCQTVLNILWTWVQVFRYVQKVPLKAIVGHFSYKMHVTESY